MICPHCGAPAAPAKDNPADGYSVGSLDLEDWSDGPVVFLECSTGNHSHRFYVVKEISSSVAARAGNPKPEIKMTAQQLIGLKITEARPMTKEEMDAESWSDRYPPTVLVLENGIKLYPSCDPEGNGGGALFGVKDGVGFQV